MAAKSSPEAPSSDVMRRRDGEAAALRKRAGRAFARRAWAPGEGRADQIGEPLEDIDADGALAVDAEAEALIDLPVERRVDARPRSVRSRDGGELGKAGHVEVLVLQRPELREQRARAGLQQGRHIEVMRAEADAVAAQQARASWSSPRTSSPRRAGQGCRGSPPGGRRCRAPCRSASGRRQDRPAASAGWRCAR